MEEVLITLPTTPRRKGVNKLKFELCEQKFARYSPEDEVLPEYVSPFLLKLVAKSAPLELDHFTQLLIKPATKESKLTTNPQQKRHGCEQTGERGIQSLISAIRRYNERNATKKGVSSSLASKTKGNRTYKPNSAPDSILQRKIDLSEHSKPMSSRELGYTQGCVGGEEDQTSSVPNNLKGKNTRDITSLSKNNPIPTSRSYWKHPILERRKPLWFTKASYKAVEALERGLCSSANNMGEECPSSCFSRSSDLHEEDLSFSFSNSREECPSSHLSCLVKHHHLPRSAPFHSMVKAASNVKNGCRAPSVPHIGELQGLQHACIDDIRSNISGSGERMNPNVEQGQMKDIRSLPVKEKIVNVVQNCRTTTTCTNDNSEMFRNEASEALGCVMELETKQRNQKEKGIRLAISAVSNNLHLSPEEMHASEGGNAKGSNFDLHTSVNLYVSSTEKKDATVHNLIETTPHVKKTIAFPTVSFTDESGAVRNNDVSLVNNHRQNQVHESLIVSTRLAEVVDICCQKGFELLRAREATTKEKGTSRRKRTDQSWKNYQRTRRFKVSKRATRSDLKWSIYANPGNKLKAINASKLSEVQFYLEPLQMQHRFKNWQMLRDLQETPQQREIRSCYNAMKFGPHTHDTIGPWTPTPDTYEFHKEWAMPSPSITERGKWKTGLEVI